VTVAPLREQRHCASIRAMQGDGVELAVRDEGDGQPVLLLHGFPDTSYVWRHQIEALTAAGMRCIAPDLRGRGASERPEGVEAYAIRHSVADAVAILDGLNIDKAHVVAHDFGAGVAWALASLHPARVDRFVAMSVGHPFVARSLRQRELAWYQLLFQFEGLAEKLLRKDDWRLFREWLRDDGDAERYIEDLSQPGALTAGLNWYRANLHPKRELEQRPPLPPIEADTLGIWSSGDHYLTEERMAGSGEFVSGRWRYERIEGASHWMQLDAPQEVNDLLLTFLSE
jgi:pimeloyl-ACP methyl ester carboxylesterase